jgi:hypothetical protein
LAGDEAGLSAGLAFRSDLVVSGRKIHPAGNKEIVSKSQTRVES